MKKFILFTLLCFQCAYAETSLEKYFSYMKEIDKPNGDWQKGEIQLVVDSKEIFRIQNAQEERLIKKGFSKECARESCRVGVINEDQYWLWLRDAVYFPGGIPGTYNRLLWKNQLKCTSSGVAILPILPSNEIILLLNFRHATRSWELELPRGGMELGESREETAARELKEETGYTASIFTFLGEIATDTGVHAEIVPVIMAKIVSQEESSPEYSEAIAAIISFTKEELKAGIIKGYVEVLLKGEKRKVPLRDAFLIFALYQAELRGLL